MFSSMQAGFEALNAFQSIGTISYAVVSAVDAQQEGTGFSSGSGNSE